MFPGDDDMDANCIAIFIDMKEGINTRLSYMHVGQHATASLELLKNLREATKEEYANLLAEIKRIGYEDIVIV